MNMITPPDTAYGILKRCEADSPTAEAAEQIRNLGYAILDSGYSTAELDDIAERFEVVKASYFQKYDASRLKKTNEHNTIRAPLLHGGPTFLKLATNQNLKALLQDLISGKFVLNQQNGVINPAGESYNQGAWHRDLPYQHFVSSKPLAINALFCVDDFSAENGATFVLPASHKSEDFPSPQFIKRNALQIVAPRGSFIVLDCMLFHAGGFNGSSKVRRGINHVFTIPYFKQQINLPANLVNVALTPEIRDLLGFNLTEPQSIEEYLATRGEKAY